MAAGPIAERNQGIYCYLLYFFHMLYSIILLNSLFLSLNSLISCMKSLFCEKLIKSFPNLQIFCLITTHCAFNFLFQELFLYKYLKIPKIISL